GGFTFINFPLVKYRWHGANTTFGLHQARPQTAALFRAVQAKRRVELDRFVEVYKGFAADAERALQAGLMEPAEYLKIKKRILREGRRFELRSKLFLRSWLWRLTIFCR